MIELMCTCCTAAALFSVAGGPFAGGDFDYADELGAGSEPGRFDMSE
jgi:hypothetical protein